MKDKKDKVIASLLAFFGGGIGLQKFYLGQSGKGIMSILFCWTPFPYIVAIYDCIKFLNMSQERFDMRYNSHLYAFPNNRIMSSNINVADELHKLDDLFKRGVITFEEFEKRKSLLLNS